MVNRGLENVLSGGLPPVVLVSERWVGNGGDGNIDVSPSPMSAGVKRGKPEVTLL